MLDRAFLDRFLAAPLDADVRGWALGLILGSMPPAERREERDRLIRSAAALIPGPPWTRARRLHGIARQLVGALPAAPDTSTARGCIAAAMLLSPGRSAPCVDTIYRVIACNLQ